MRFSNAAESVDGARDKDTASTPHHVIVFAPPVTMHNLLPYELELEVTSEEADGEGQMTQLALGKGVVQPVYAPKSATVHVRMRCRAWMASVLGFASEVHPPSANKI